MINHVIKGEELSPIKMSGYIHFSYVVDPKLGYCTLI